MDQIMNYLYWMKDNYAELLSSIAVLVMALEMIVRLTPTKKDDSFMERVSSKLNWLMNLLKVPNVKREDGKIIAGVHKPKP